MNHLIKLSSYFTTILRLKKYSDVCRFRLENAFMVGIGIALLAPIIITLKGTLLSVSTIAMFSILSTIAVKSNDFFCRFSISELYRFGIGVHILLVVTALLFFINPLWMIVMESLLGILEISIFSAYGVLLTNHLSENRPGDMKKFQIDRNNIWSDAALIGLGIATLIGLLYPVYMTVIIFVLYNGMFSIYMISKWNFFEERGL